MRLTIVNTASQRGEAEAVVVVESQASDPEETPGPDPRPAFEAISCGNRRPAAPSSFELRDLYAWAGALDLRSS